MGTREDKHCAAGGAAERFVLAVANWTTRPLRLGRDSERNSESNLSFTPRQNLGYRSERLRSNVLPFLNRGWVLTIQQIEKLKEYLCLDSFADVKTLGEAQIDIDEWRRGEGISPRRKIDTVEITIAVWVSVQSVEAAKVKTALCANNAADLKLPRKIRQAVDLKDMNQGQA